MSLWYALATRGSSPESVPPAISPVMTFHLQPKKQVFPVTCARRCYIWSFLIAEWYGLYELILFSLILSWQNTEGNYIFCLSFCAHTCCADSVRTYGGKTIGYLLAQCLNNYPETICGYLKFSMFTRWLADCYNKIFHPKFCFRKVGEIFVYRINKTFKNKFPRKSACCLCEQKYIKRKVKSPSPMQYRSIGFELVLSKIPEPLL